MSHLGFASGNHLPLVSATWHFRSRNSNKTNVVARRAPAGPRDDAPSQASSCPRGQQIDGRDHQVHSSRREYRAHAAADRRGHCQQNSCSTTGVSREWTPRHSIRPFDRGRCVFRQLGAQDVRSGRRRAAATAATSCCCSCAECAVADDGCGGLERDEETSDDEGKVQHHAAKDN